MSTVSPQYYDGFRAAVGAAKHEVETPAGAVSPSSETGSPEPAEPVALCGEERIKRELHPLDAFPRLLDCAQDNRPPGRDDCFRFRWFGLFYQGPQQDAFVLRLRLPGGRLQSYQLEGLAALTQELAGGHVIANAQGGLDVPGVAVRDAVEVLRRVEAIGLRTLLSGGDCVRAVRGGEYEGLEEDSRPPVIYPLVRELEQALAMDRRSSDLPAGCEVVVCGHGEEPPTGDAEGGTLVFRAACASPGTSDAEDSSGSLFLLTVPGFGPVDATLTVAQVVPACLELLGRWSEQDERAGRGNAGIAAFCAGVGNHRLREWLARRTGPLAALSSDPPMEVASPPPVGVPVPGGCLLSAALERLADAARRYGSNEVRLAGGRLFVPRAIDPPAAESALHDALRQP